MQYAALITWFVAILAGLYMLAVWLIENDVTPSRLPAPVIFSHLFLAATGLTLWVGGSWSCTGRRWPGPRLASCWESRRSA
jgi:hypothetical protein